MSQLDRELVLPADYLPAIDPIDAIESAPCMLQVRSGKDD